MNLVSVNSISKTAGNKKLFENVTFGIDEGQKIALIGVNGTGKTTLLKIIAGTESVDSGNVSKNKALKIGILEQIPVFIPEHTILQHIFNSNNNSVILIRRYEELCGRMDGNMTPDEEKELHDIIDELDKKQLWDFEHNIRSILNELEIFDLSLKMKTLSGGMLKKVALAQSLIGDANLLIMDEPTNHLDLRTVAFLEEHLKKTDKAVILVTHDRYFLDSICGIILEIERNAVYKFEGNYTYYLEKKAEIENSLLKEENKIEGLLRKELDWYRRQPKARTTKSKARMQSIETMMTREKLHKTGDVELTISGRRLGKKILEVTDITKSFNDRVVVKPFSYVFKQKEKIGVIGNNGSGKTTLLNMLIGSLKPDSGTVDPGINTVFGYFTQNKENFDPGMRIIDYVKAKAEYIVLSDGSTISASKMLERFLFTSNTHYSAISMLSGGEKRRLYLLSVLMGNPNFLILDEPTNDLDIKTLSVLENFLNDFGGCIIIVTHDRYFMNRVVDHLLVFDDNGNIESFPGNYSDYLDYDDMRKKNRQTGREGEGIIEEKEPVKEKKKISFKEKKELEQAVKDIEALENEKKELDKRFSRPGIDPENIREISAKYAEIEGSLEKLINRWEYLAELEE